MKGALILASLFVTCCSNPQIAVPQDWSAAKTKDQKQAFMNSIADGCHLSHGFFRVRDDDLIIQPRPDENYENVDCALKALKPLRPTPNLGFIGNEYVPENKQ